LILSIYQKGLEKEEHVESRSDNRFSYARRKIYLQLIKDGEKINDDILLPRFTREIMGKTHRLDEIYFNKFSLENEKGTHLYIARLIQE